MGINAGASFRTQINYSFIFSHSQWLAIPISTHKVVKAGTIFECGSYKMVNLIVKFGNLIKTALLAGAGMSLMACSAQMDDVRNGIGPQYFSHHQDETCCTVIAHAGGAIDGNAYTNSQEAVMRNYNYGTRLFELDFDITSDGHWVAAHDWPNWKAQTGFDGAIPPSLAEYNATLRKYKKVSWSLDGEYSPIDMV